ncbi:D-alanyl-D-alanine carboxypeptidase family protein [Limosilactobacillus sp.]|uniref:D-alanyl-D-alanine carboxypeptidase family protein n=1 Tax=Limosilactobacillus sp. TaxID=2773925 RepID=UPI003F0BA0B2
MKKIGHKLIHFLLLFLALNLSLAGLAGHAKASDDAFYNMKARAAYAIDAQTGQVLYQKNANKTYPIASLTKILTLAVIEQDIRDHKLSWNQKIKITPEVAKVANDWHFSNVQLNAGEQYSVRQLVESMMLVSADGSTEALALADAGSTAAFNRKMQAVAKEAGVTDAKIYNMIGLPNSSLGKHRLKNIDKDAENEMSAKDLALISRYVINKYPETLKITKKKFANFDVTAGQQYQMVNINALLPQNGYAPQNWDIDGLKTGNTDAAGKCIVTTGTYAGRRVILVALHTKGDWNNQSKMQKEFYEALAANYQPVELKKITELPKQVQQTRVVHAKKKRNVRLQLAKPQWVWLKKGDDWKATKPRFIPAADRQSVTGKLEAPLKKGQHVGEIELQLSGMPSLKLPVNSSQTIAVRSFWDR